MNGEQTINIFTRILQIIDLNTLILISAFVFGLLIIILGISLVICVCKRLNKPKIKLPNTKITNPLYDTSNNNNNYKDIEFKLISINQDLNNNNNNNNNDIEEENEQMNNSNETEKLLQEPTLTVTTSNNTNMNTMNKSNLNSSSLLNTSSCSTSSIDSVILKPQDDSPPPVPSVPPPISTPPPSPHIPSTPRTEPVKKSFETNSVKRASIFTPVSAAKSTQQLLQEQKLADSKIPAYKRTISQSNEFNNNNNNNNETYRMSAASSRSSIHQAINFDQIKGDIDDWAVNKGNFVSRSNLASSSHNSSQIIDMDRSDSIPDIYIKEMIRKHEEIKKNKTNNDISLSSSSVNSSFKSNNINNNTNNNGQKNRSGDRRSMNIAVSDINFNTNPTNDLKSSKLDSASVYTVASEKSCY